MKTCAKMKKIGLAIMAAFMMYPASGQGNISNFDTKAFPKVSFTIKTYNPNILGKDAFHIKEEGVTADIISVTPIGHDTPQQKGHLLFLWDYRDNVRKNENFAAELLRDFLKPGTGLDGFNVNVSLFRRDPKEGPIYLPLLESFSDDFTEANTAVYDEYIKEAKDKSQASDIVWALSQAVNQMSALPLDEPKAIILLTSGNNNIATGMETMPLISSAKKNRILIYTINISGNEAGINLCKNITEKTYGEYMYSKRSYAVQEKRKQENDECKNKRKPEIHTFIFEENDTLHAWMTNLPARWEGTAYKISYKSHYGRIDKTKQISVKAGDDEFITTFDVPGFSLGVWIKEHVMLFIIILILSLAALGCGIYFTVRHIRKASAKKKREKERHEAEQKRLKNEQDALRRKLELAEHEQRRRQEQEQIREKETQRQEYLSNINRLMLARNIKARILVCTMTGSKEYMMNNAELSIGTAEDNAIVIDDRTVSRHHAILYFNGEHFGIRDLNSTNGIVMNGFKMKEMKLRNGDSVSLGNTMIKIYY